MNWRCKFLPHRWSSFFKSQSYRRRLFGWLIFGWTIAFLIIAPNAGAQKKKATPAPANPATLEVQNRQGTKMDSLVDGDAVKLIVRLNQAAELAHVASFKFVDDGHEIGKCIIGVGKQSCEIKVLPALGWAWDKNGKLQPEREIRVESGDAGMPDATKFSGTARLRIAPRPVVLVHGLASDAATWAEYTKPGGYLATVGLRGFAVGDKQAEGRMSTGDPAAPLTQTNTISQNAENLALYIQGVKRATGAQMVDLVAHSMGSLVARYYVDRLMVDKTRERDVGQLIMLGAPNGGSGCASLPASLGFYLPATLELRPAYLAEVFNRQITHRHGVPFYLLAGNPIVESFKSPCTAAPSDLVVSRMSAGAITAPIIDAPMFHTDMTGSEKIFKDFVAPHLRGLAGDFPAESDPEPPAAASAPEQFTKVYTGHVDFGASREVVINLDQLSVADFALYDTTRSLIVTVRGANGNVINLTPEANGLVRVDNPAALFTLGYGFNNPKPGAWKIMLQATPQTPGKGADYAIEAKVVGGATLWARADRMIVRPGQPITISSALELSGRPLPEAVIQARVRHPDGAVEEIAFSGGDEKRVVWTPQGSGFYAVDVIARSSTPDGAQIDRADFLSFEVQPDPNQGMWRLALLTIAGITLVTAIIFWLMNRRKNKAR